MDTLVNIFPSNFISPMVEANMLQVIVMAIILGFAIILVGEKNVRVVNAFNDLNEIFMKCMEMILKLSPIGVFCLLCPVIASNGPTIIGSLAMVLLAAYICYFVHAVVVYSLTVSTLGGMSPVKFFKGMMPAIMFAFSSASSVGTLPINLSCTEKLGAKREIASFVLPLGATINMDGTAIYQGVCAIFICILLWYSADSAADADHCPDCNFGFHRNRRCTGSRYGYAGNGTDLCWTSNRWYRAGSRC